MNEWIDMAVCRRFDAELFFPVGSGPAAARQTARAKAVCASCPVSQQCLAWALRNGEIDGIWGGLDVDERRVLHRSLELPRQRGSGWTNWPGEIAPTGAVRCFQRGCHRWR
jgi:WhiB family transcriptional regulator, redox-sensing transcriptional regulator